MLAETIVDRQGRPRIVTPSAGGEQPARISYFVGDDASRHRSGLRTYDRVDLGQPYPGITLHLRATGSNVEKIFTVAAGADPAAIRIRVDGASKLAVNDRGELVANMPGGPLNFTKPVAFQHADDGAEIPVAVRYAIDPRTATYRFVLGSYDRLRPLTIDPLIASTYLGGAQTDYIFALAINPTDGTVYVTGITFSTGFPATGGAYTNHAADGGDQDAYVTRFSADLQTFLSGTFYGGNGSDWGTAIAINDFGQVLVAGTTDSTNLPVGDGAGAMTTKSAPGQQSYVAMFSPSLGTLIRTTHFSGTDGATYLRGMLLTPDGLYITGDTTSTTLPSTSGAAQPAIASLLPDAFVSRLGTDLKTIVRSTYFGGSQSEAGYAIAMHGQSGDVVIAGSSFSPSLPGVAGGGQSVAGGGIDGFVARISGGLDTVRQSTFYGGGDTDIFQAVAVHPFTGDIYAGGQTKSLGLPHTSASAQPAHGGGDVDALLVRISPDLRTIMRATYFGGSSSGQFETVSDVAVHRVSGEIYVGGTLYSGDTAGMTNGIQAATGGGQDAFVARFRATLEPGVQATYYGDSGNDAGTAMAIHPLNGDIYLAGYTVSNSLPGAAGGAFPARAGLTDGFITRLSPDLTFADKTPNQFAFAPVFGAIADTFVHSAPVQINGFGGTLTTYITGGSSARYCVSSAADCQCDVIAFTAATLTTLTAGGYVCMRDRASTQPNGLSLSTLHAGGGAASFVVVTGPALASPCSLDVDGNGSVDALSDGLMILRAMFGLTGAAVTNNAVSGNPPRSTWVQIRNYLNGNCGTSFQP